MRVEPSLGAVEAIARRFALSGPVKTIDKLSRGHIHDSFIVTAAAAKSPGCRYLLQRVNRHVFTRPQDVMQNIRAVSDHLVTKLTEAGQPGFERRCIRLTAALDGTDWVVDADGEWWRALSFIDGALSFATVDTIEQAKAVGRAFGEFQSLLTDLEVNRLVETIPNFHRTDLRFAAFNAALERDAVGRAAACADAVSLALRGERLCHLLDARHAGASLPLRVVHNDAKLDNVLFDEVSLEALCVVDLDTVMPGLVAHDFGDLVRTGAGRFAEDERDLTRVAIDLALFRAITLGYLAQTRTWLSRAEVESLPVAGQVIAYETGLRFLSDHLDGDVYFRAHWPGHNLARALVQFRLVESIERNLHAMQDIVTRISSGDT